MKKFCPNCGKELKTGATFCSNCGFKVESSANSTKQDNQQAQPQVTQQAQQNTQTQSVASKQPRQPMSTKNKIILWTVGILAVLLIGFYEWGSHYYSKENQIIRIASTLKNPNEDLSEYVEADTPDMKVTKESLQPLQRYYQDHQPAVTKMSDTLKYSNQATKDITLVRDGRYFLLFPKYKLQVKTFQPQVVSNHGDTTVTMDGKNVGKLSGDSSKYYKKLNLLFPGKYHFNVESEVEGRKLTASSTANIFSNKTLNMEIKTQTFKVKSVPNGDVYINDKKAGSLDDKGEATFKAYPITKNMELYVTFKSGKNVLKSKIVTDMAEAFGAFDDSGSDYDDDSQYNDDASDENIDDVVKDDGTYVVEPKWSGIIATDDAETILGRAFDDVEDDDFVDGSANNDYSDLQAQQKSWNDSDAINSWSTDVTVESVYPAADNSSSVVYKVEYEFDHDDYTRKQVMEFKGAVIQKDGSDYKIKTIGNGKIISDKKESN